MWKFKRRPKPEPVNPVVQAVRSLVANGVTVRHEVTHERKPYPMPVSGRVMFRTRDGMPYAIPFTILGDRRAVLSADIPPHASFLQAVEFDYQH